jgi:hydrogenase expression/formation protein HypC
MCLGVPGKIVSATGDGFARMSKVDFAGAVKDVSLAYVPEAQVGEYVIVHVGFAISRVDEEEAQRTLQTLRELAEQQAEETG